MASIKKYKTKNKGELWLFKVDVGKDPITGARKSTTKRGFKSRKEAQLAAADVERDVAGGNYTPDSTITFAKFSEEFLEAYEPTVKMSSYNIRSRAVTVLNKHFGQLKLKDVTRKIYQEMLLAVQKKYAYNTASIFHITGKMIFKKAIEYGILTVDPTEYVKLVRVKQTVEEVEAGELPKYMEKDELADFLAAVKERFTHQDYTLFLTLAYTGMRLGELIALKWSDVTFDNQTIRISKTCYFPKNSCTLFHLLTPKTKASRREIVVDPIVISELKKLKFLQNNLKNNPYINYVDHDFIFTSQHNPGYPYSKVTAQYKMRKVLKETTSYTKTLTPHSLRHTHTSLLAEAKVDITEIMERLGHQDDSVTRRVYLHVTKKKRLDASNRFSALMESAVIPRSKENQVSNLR